MSVYVLFDCVSFWYVFEDKGKLLSYFNNVCVFTGWIRYSERVLGSLVTPHICTARSPQQIMGCLVKDYFSKQQVSVYCHNSRMHLV